ncbi:MAG: hypothetical protein OHK0046_45900 [Anaerolineae bacterium]
MNEQPTQDKIAIIGLSCLFPGAASPAEFWHNLIHGLNTTSLATEAQFGVDPAVYYDPQRRTHDTTYALRGGYVQTPVEIPAGMDRAAAWTLHVARQALNDSRLEHRADVLARCGLILGNLSFPTPESYRLVAPVYTPALEQAVAELTGIADFQLPQPEPVSADVLRSPAAVVADVLGLGGIQFTLDAACASSLYTIGLASAYLQAGKADVMLAGAVSAADPLFVNMGFTHFGAYPEKGESRPLDESSDGLVSGEGAGLLVLKRYTDAVRDGDTIYAVIAGVGLSNDGRGKHPLTPNPRGQILALKRAYQNGLDPRSVQYVECHASGTPLGDKTELASMDDFFGGYGVTPRIGSVKANHGHLLTVAGLASVLKVILSMQHGQIPATIGVQTPLTSQRFGNGQVVQQNTAWTDTAKTAGVNAFGFGGVSAHLVLQNPAAAGQPQAQAASHNKPRLAIVGMDAQFGGCDGLEDFAQTLYSGQQHFRPLPPKRWKGLAEDAPEAAYIDSFEIDFLRYKFPPKEDDQPTPQHLLLLKVADNAVQDAGLAEDSNVAVIVVLGHELSLHQYRSRLDMSWQVRDSLNRSGYDLAADDGLNDLERMVKDAISPPAQVNQYTSYIGNIVSSRVSALWNFSGPAFTLTSGENGVYKALEVAQILLADTTLEAVVIGAVDLAAGVESVTLRGQQYPLNTGTLTLSFDEHANGWQAGEGAGAVVLKRAEDVRGQRVYATLESVAVVPGGEMRTVVQSMEAALNTAGITPQQVGYLEASASGIADEDAVEMAALNQVYRRASDKLTTALGSVKANVGHTGAASGIASLIKAALLLQRRFIAAVPQWTAPKHAAEWADSAFYVAQDSQTWFSPAGKLRYAAISGLGQDGTSAHVILSDDMASHDAQSGTSYLKHKSLRLFPIDANDLETLMHRLRQLELALDSDQPLPVLAANRFAAYRSSGRYAVVIIGDSRDMLRREIQLALTGIPQAYERGGDWQTPAGSAFSANPLGTKGGIAFVYPGAFNSYPTHGRDWMHLFPSALAHVMGRTRDIGDQVAETLLYPRSLAAPTRAEVREARTILANNQRAMMESGILFAVMYTYVMRQVFRLTPDMTFGYSLGENSMLWAMDVWQNSEEARAILHNTPLFESRLSGRKDAVREAWGLPPQTGNDFWASYVLVASAAEVLEQIAHETRVYLTHVNTPTEVVIAGDPQACERVIGRVGCESIRAPFETVIHNEAIMSEYDAFFRLYHQPVHRSAENITFYSAADYEPIRLDQDLVARSVARVACKQVDFPRLIHRAYRDGARIFIELGPASTCTRWINDTLRAEDREHVAVAIDHLRLDDHTALMKLLARLVSHRVPLDLAALYEEPISPAEHKRLPRTITLGGEPVRDVILSEQNRRRVGSMRWNRVPSRAAYAAPRAPEPVYAAPVPVMEAEVVGGTHDSRLQNRLSGLRELGAFLRDQLQNPSITSATPAPVSMPVPQPQVAPPVVPLRYTPRPAVFDRETIDQFARGSIKACFGPEYAIYDNKRAPRIPNTDLMLLTRLVEVNATRLVTKTGSSMVAEYDVPPDMWFYRDNSYPFAPYSMLMEMALQPCGFLSAFMGPTLDFPEIDFYFRNLDGQGKLIRDVDLRGRTLVNRVELLSSTILQGIIIQKYAFNMMLDGESFYVGNSTFGYFTLQALSSQAGLDMGKPPTKWHEANSAAALVRMTPQDATGPLTLPTGQLAFLDEALINVNGGRNGLGYIYARKDVHPADWYFKCHFHQDPVMPGSLGLETVTQAIQAYAIEAGLTQEMRAPHFALVEDHDMVWKYRGQVLSEIPDVQVEVHITQVTREGDHINITADASLWKDTLRIYEFKNVGVRIQDTRNQ